MSLAYNNDHSIAWAIAKEYSPKVQRRLQPSPGQPDDARQRNRRRLPCSLTEAKCKFLVPMDVGSQIAAVMKKTQEEFGTVNFLIHSIAYAPMEDLKGETTDCSREGFQTASNGNKCHSLRLSAIIRISPGCFNLDLTYFGGEKVVPGYNIMGIYEATLDTCVKYML